MHQLQTGFQRHLYVSPKADHWVKLENTPTLNRLKIVVIQKVKDDILSQTGANQSGQPDDQKISKVALNEFLEQTPVQAVGVKIFFIDWRSFIHPFRTLEHVDCADQDKGLALDGFHVRNKTLNFLPIGIGLAVSNPLLRRRAGANKDIERLPLDVDDIC